MRSKPEEIGENIRRIVLLGEEYGKPDFEETWLVFTSEAKTFEGEFAGYVEVAFSITLTSGHNRFSVQSVADSRLVVFFPTVLPTHLGFLVQGPYCTTPSRDNVPRSDPWNQYLAEETAKLLVVALRSLRTQGLLDVDAIRSLPLDRTKFSEDSMFAPLFGAVREALRTEPLLPTYGDGHVSANTAKLARTQELRELFDPHQLASVFGASGDFTWLSSDISQDRTQDIRQYLMRELGVVEVTPEMILPKLDRSFFAAQPDEWVLSFYEFLNGQPALLRQGRLNSMPMIRLEDGTQVTAKLNGEPCAFLPGAAETGFPTVRPAVCTTDEARSFLLSLGLTEPDPVDDVVRNILHKYRSDEVSVGYEDYAADIRRILIAFATDSKGQREKLVEALRESSFVMTFDAGDESKRVSKPDESYMATDRLKNLFAGVPNVYLVDDSYSCLRGEDVRDLLEACGATRYLQPVSVPSRFTSEELKDMRTRAGLQNNTGEDNIEDFTLRGLTELLATMKNLNSESAAKKAALLWMALCDVEDRRGTNVFLGTYEWFYFQPRSCVFDTAFVDQLNSTAWVPDANGDLKRPEFILFDTLGWKPNPFLISKIRFKPPIIAHLAKEAGIEPGVLELLKKLGVTSIADLNRYGIKEDSEKPVPTTEDDVDNALRKLLGGLPEPTPPVPDPMSPEPTGPMGNFGGGIGPSSGSRGGGKNRLPGSQGGRAFISYVGAQPNCENSDSDPDGIDQQARMELEEMAIKIIIVAEPQLQRTPTGNQGFDLLEADESGSPIRWVEVKAMTGSLHDRPVGLSHTQFECAQEHNEEYWLYVVEHTGQSNARIIRIQNPAGKARTFTFDHGWLDIASVDDEQENHEV